MFTYHSSVFRVVFGMFGWRIVSSGHLLEDIIDQRRRLARTVVGLSRAWNGDVGGAGGGGGAESRGGGVERNGEEGAMVGGGGGQVVGGGSEGQLGRQEAGR